MPEAEIAPTAASRAEIDRPIAVVDGVGVASPATYYVHTDHLHRPIRMSNAVKSIVWSADYQPWGAVQSLSGALTLDLRFPGQWFQLEAGLHYNWHRHYDATLGRYTQPDPLGFVDGPSVFGYAGGSPYGSVDPDGRYLPGGPQGRPRPGTLPDGGGGGGSFPWPWTSGPKLPVPVPLPTPSPGIDIDGSGTGSRTVPEPPHNRGQCTAICRVDCNDNIIGNCPDPAGKKFAFGIGVAKDCRAAKFLAKENAKTKLKCQTKHDVSCKTSPKE